MKWKFWQKQKDRSLECAGVPMTGANTDYLFPDYTTTASGANVTPESSWNYSAVYAAVRLLSETIAQLPLMLYQEANDRTQPAKDHPVYNLAHNGPSDRLTSFIWRETQMGHALTWGNGYAFIGRDATGKVRELTLLNPAATYVNVNTDGTFYYQTTLNDRTFRIEPENVLHVPALGWDGYRGKSPISMHRETIGLSQSATKFGAQLFGNGTNIGGVIKHPGSLGPEARQNLKKSFDAYRGNGYQGALVLDESMEYQRIGIPPEDAQFLETRKFQVSEIARIYNIPPHMLRDLEKSSFNNISEQSIEFLRYSIAPWLVKWEQELNRKLLTEGERQGGYYFKVSSGGLLRGTQKERYEAYGKGIGDGWLSRNEVRALEDLDPVDGLDEYLVPLNMANTDEVETVDDGDETEPAPAERRIPDKVMRAAESYAAWLRDVDDRAKDYKSLSDKLQKKLPAMNERYIEPIVTAAKVREWNSWLMSHPVDSLPGAEDIASAVMDIIEGTENANRAA